MNWKTTIKQLLGGFWSRMFGERDFILWVENLFSFLAAGKQGDYDRAVADRALSLIDNKQTRLPYCILLLCSSEKDGVETSAVGHPANSLLSVLHGADPGGLDADRGWSLMPDRPVPRPTMLSAHVSGHGYTLFAGLDFDVEDTGALTLYVSPAALDWPTECLMSKDGVLHTYYKVFGWADPVPPMEDAVAAFESRALCEDAVATWRVHQEGATVLSAASLLCSACDSVVCAASGSVDDIWTEEAGRLHCMLVDGHLYSSYANIRADLAVGSVVRAGDVLFGPARFYFGALTASPTDVPGIHVMTDAGEVFARNREDTSSLSINGEYVLGVEAAPDVLSAYVNRCAELIKLRAPYISVPASCNPCRFILERLRAGSYMLMTATTDNVVKLSAALECVRRSAAASGLFQVYINAKAEPVIPASMSISASAMHCGVCTVISVGIANVAARARVFI